MVRAYLLGNGDLLIGELDKCESMILNPVIYKYVSGVFPAPPRIQGGPVTINPACLPTLVPLPIPFLTVTESLGYWDGDEDEVLSKLYTTFIKGNAINAGISGN